MRSEPGPPMTLGGAAIAGVRIILWCKACHRADLREICRDTVIAAALARADARRGGAAPPGDLTSFSPEGDQVPLLRFLALLTRGRPQAGPGCDPSVPTEADASFFTLSKRKGLPHL